MAKKKPAKARKKIAAKKKGAARKSSSRKRPGKKVGVKAAPKKKRPPKMAARKAKKKIAGKRKVATKPAAVERPPLAPVQNAMIRVEQVPSAAEASQPQSSLIDKPITGTGGEASSTLLMRPMPESQSLDMVQEASEESFPASDSPAITRRKPR